MMQITSNTLCNVHVRFYIQDIPVPFQFDSSLQSDEMYVCGANAIHNRFED